MPRHLGRPPQLRQSANARRVGPARRGWHAGRYALPFGLETKAKGGKLNDDQKRWHRRADEFGFPVFTCDSLAAVRDAVKMLREL